MLFFDLYESLFSIFVVLYTTLLLSAKTLEIVNGLFGINEDIFAKNLITETGTLFFGVATPNSLAKNI